MESGAFKDAANYFSEQLKQFPDNKTVQICFARSIGLSNDPELALKKFIALDQQYPGDLEVRLNLAESYLWNGQYQDALQNYLELTASHPRSFAAMLGLANSYSNTQNYPEAFEAIEKAISIDPQNQGAKTSKFYILLGYADQQKKAKNFEKAESLLELLRCEHQSNTQVLQAFGMLLFEQKQYEDAAEMFNAVKDPVIRLTHLALTSQAKGKSKAALDFAEEAVNQVNPDKFEDYRLAQERYVQALLWNEKFAQAKKQIDGLANEPRMQKSYLSLLANWYGYTDRPVQSLATYNLLLTQNPTSFDALMGKANALKALNKKEQATQMLDSVLKYYPGQADALSLKAAISESLKTVVSTQFAFQQDNDQNDTYFTGVRLELPLNANHGFSLNYGFRETTQQSTGLEATSNQITLGYTRKIHNRTTATAAAGFTKVTTGAAPYTQWNAKLELNTRLMARNSFILSYERTIQDFNASLLAEELVLNNYVLSNNSMLVGKLGWYTQGRFIAISDDNTSTQLFTSLYYSLGKKYLFKFGLNYQFLQFQEDRSELYFSPESFHSGELFGRFDHSAKRIKIGAELALGRQLINQDEPMNTFRSSLDLRYNYNSRINLGIFGRYSNSASDAASGFSFYQIGLGGQIKL